MRLLTLLLTLACIGCSSGLVAAPPLAASTAPAAGLLPQIRALAANTSCTASTQCHTLALGARACGGPQAYMAWSSVHTDGAALRALGERHVEQEKARIVASGEMSDCRMVVDPGAECRAGTCQLRGAATGAGANQT